MSEKDKPSINFKTSTLFSQPYRRTDFWGKGMERGKGVRVSGGGLITFTKEEIAVDLKLCELGRFKMCNHMTLLCL